ncbi:MAG: AEC family transporter [Eubacteriales bacterium]
MNLYNVFQSILTLFIIGIVGYFARKKEILTESTINNLPKFLLEITLPCMIISSMQLPFSQEKLKDIKTILFISLGVYLASYLLSILVIRGLKVTDRGEEGVYQFMTIFSNVAFIGYPVLISIYSKEAIFYAAIYNLPFNFLVFTLGVFILQSDRKKLGLSSFINPGLISVIIGLILYFFSLKIPPIILDPVIMVGDLTTPLSMIFIGASISHVDFKKILLDWRLYFISVIRLLVIPILLFFILKGFIDDPLLIGIPVVISGMPVAANCAVMAKQYGEHADLASEGIFMTTTLSMVTIPFLVYILANFIS